VLEPPSVDVLVVSYNTRDLLRGTLRSLLAHAPSADAADLRVRVLDNGSADGSADMVATEFPQVGLTRSPVNRGFGRANNELAAASDADYVMLLNSDVVMTQDVVTPLLDALAGDPAAIAAGPRMIFPDGQVQCSAQRLPSLSYEFAAILRGRRLGRALARIFDSQARVDAVHETAHHERPGAIRRPTFMWATCWLVRRADVPADGLFDDAFPMYDEDLDFCRRAAAGGRTLLYVPSAELVHLGGASSATTGAKRRLMRRARLRYYRRHHGRLQAALYGRGLPVVDACARLVAAIPRPSR
jgi:N-acetylglucosaminyl-diphospho-decaprenol L-rhamnosyltransferase